MGRDQGRACCNHARAHGVHMHMHMRMRMHVRMHIVLLPRQIDARRDDLIIMIHQLHVS